MDLHHGFYDVPPRHIAAVVTSLEMFSRPAARPEPVSAGWRLARWDPPELEAYRDLFRRVGGPWLWFSRLKLGDEALHAILHDPAVEVFALENEGVTQGILELDFRVPQECELAFLGVTMSLVGTGAGTWLMNRALERAWARPIGRFWVHTCTLDHPGAVAFYRKSGFRPFRQQVEIDLDPRTTGALPADVAPQFPVI